MDLETVWVAIQIGFGLSIGVALCCAWFKVLSLVIEAAEVAVSSGVRGVGWCVKQLGKWPKAKKK